AFHTEFLWDKKALTVVEVDTGMNGAERRIALLRDRGVTREHVNFTGLQCSKALLRIERYRFEFCGIPKHGSRYRAAQVDIQTCPGTLAVWCGKPCEACGNAAVQLAAVADGLKRISLSNAQAGSGKQAAHAKRFQFQHSYSRRDNEDR